MTASRAPLAAVDRVEITIVMDNAIDLLLADTDVAQRVLPRLGPNPFERPQPLAEHGFSVLIRVAGGDRRAGVLFDTGVSPRGLLHNLDVLEITAADIARSSGSLASTLLTPVSWRTSGAGGPSAIRTGAICGKTWCSTSCSSRIR